MRHWHSLPKEWWSYLSLEVFLNRGALEDMVSDHGGDGLESDPRSLPQS